MGKKLFSWMLTICMLLTMMPTMAWAEGEIPPVEPTETPVVEQTEQQPAQQPEQQEQQILMSPAPVAEFDGTLNIADGSIVITATGYKQGDAADETTYTGAYVINGTYELDNTAADANSNMIKISAGATAINVTLENLAVKHHGSKNSTQSASKGMISPLQVLSGTVNLTLVGDNTLIADGKCPGLYIKEGATAVIGGTGSLKSLGAHQAAGIGAASESSGVSEGAGSLIINGGTVIAEGGNEGTGIGAARNRTMESVTINGGRVTAVGGSGSYGIGKAQHASGKLAALTVKAGNIVCSGPSGAFEATSKTIEGGNFICATYPTVAGRSIAEIYFAGADENTLVSIKEGEAKAWSAYCDENGIVYAYLLDNNSVSFTASVGVEAKTVYKFATGKFTVGAECSCNPTAFDWGDTAGTAKVYNNEVTIPVTVDVDKCDMAFHKIGAITWDLDSVKVGDEAAVDASVYATADTAAGTVTLKSAATDYTVVLKATLGGTDAELTNATKEIKVTADKNAYSIDIGNGPVSVEAVTPTGPFTYKQNGVALYEDVSASDKVVITGTYSYNTADTNAIYIKDCSPTIVLENVTLSDAGSPKNVYLSTVLIEGTDATADHAKFLISGENKVLRKTGGGNARSYCGIEIKNAELTIDCVEGTNCNDESCPHKLIVEMGTASLGAGIGSRYTTDPAGFTLNIDGGYIDVTTDNYGAAIGTGWISGNEVTNEYTITINDGYINANAPSNGVAIGAGRSNGIPDTSSVTINGGTVEAVANGNGTSSAINAAGLVIAGNADVTVQGNIAANSVELKDNATLDMQEKVDCTEGNPGGSISNGYVWEDEVILGTVDVKVSGNAKLTTEGGINGSLTTSGNATAEINGVSPAGGNQDVSTSVGGVSGTVTVGAGSKVAVNEEIKGDVTAEGGATINGTDLPENVDTITVPGDKVDEVEVTDGAVSLPAGSTITKEDDSSVELSEGGTMAADGTITAGGTVTITDAEGNVVSTVVVPEGKDATVGTDGKVTAPAGTVVTDKDGKENTLTNGGTVSADGTVKKNSYGYYIPSTTPTVTPSVDSSSLNNAAQAVGSAINSGNAEMKPASGYTKEDIAKLQKEGKLNLTIEKKSGYASVADKNLIDAAIKKAGGAVSGTVVMYFDITPVLKTDDGKVVANVTDTEKPIAITIDLSADLQKAAKDGKHIAVVRCHDGKTTFLDAKLNAAKTQVTFSSADFSTYAVVAMEKQTSAQTFDAGIMVYGAMAVLAATGSAVVIGKKRK